MGRFIEIELDPGRLDQAAAAAAVSACPVDAFRLGAGGELAAVGENEDECILCGRCVELGAGAIVVRRRYGGGKEVAGAARGDDG